MQLRLKASFVGVGFTRSVGDIITVGAEVTAAEAERIVKAGYAEIVRASGTPGAADSDLEQAVAPSLPPSQAASPQPPVSDPTVSDDGAPGDRSTADADETDTPADTASGDGAGPNAAAGDDEADSPKPAKKKRKSKSK